MGILPWVCCSQEDKTAALVVTAGVTPLGSRVLLCSLQQVGFPSFQLPALFYRGQQQGVPDALSKGITRHGTAKVIHHPQTPAGTKD